MNQYEKAHAVSMRKLTRKKPSNMGPGVGYLIDVLAQLMSPVNYTALANQVKIQDRSRFLKILRWGKDTNLIKHAPGGKYVLTINGRAFYQVLKGFENA